MSKLVGRDFFPPGRDYFEVFEDFTHFVTGDTFTNTNADGGGVTVSDAGLCGIAKINPHNAASFADNEECYLHGTTEMFKFALNKPLVFEARVRPLFNTSATIGAIVGFKDAVAADTLVDTGGGPPSSYSGAVFFLKDDATWWAESSISTSQTTVDTNITATNNTWTELRIEVHDLSSTQSEIHFFIDGVECGWDVTTSPGQKIAQTVTFASATEMEICLGVKAGTANDSQYMDVDYVGCRQSR